MVKRIFRMAVFVLVAAFVVGAATGCTVRFKATDVDLESIANTTFELESVSLFDGRAG